jgi:subtilisin family serine protease
VDDDGHGTHVAATIGGATYGVAKKATLVGVRVMDCAGGGYVSGVIAGVDWVTARHAAGTPAVANMSVGTDAGEGTLALEEAIRRSIADGVTYTIAAGNGDFFGNALDACWFSPARVPQAITVSATTRTDAKASFANFGSCVDVFAPGNDVKSAWVGGSSASRTMSGTSMAAPHVSGTVALYLQRHQGASPAQVWTALRDNATAGALRSVGTGSPNRLVYTGFTGASAGGPVDAPPAPRITYRCAGRSCSFDASSSTDDSGIVAYGWAFTTGGTGQGRVITRTLPANTTPQVILTVTDRAGQRRSTVRKLTCSATSCR